MKLTVDGKNYTQPLTVKMDPRVKTTPEQLAAQHVLEMRLMDEIGRAGEAQNALRQIRVQLRAATQSAQGSLAQAISAFDAKAQAIVGQGGGGRGGGGRGAAAAGGEQSLGLVSGELGGIYSSVGASDFAPTITQTEAASEAERALTLLMARWAALRTKDLPALNAQLRAAGVAEINVTKP